MIVKNFKELAKTKERELILEMFDVGLDAIDTEKAIKKAVKVIGNELKIGNEKFSLDNIERLFVVGVGKCSLSAASALEGILGDNLTGGTVIDVRKGKLNKIHAINGDHPLPSEKNMNATKEVIDLLSGVTENDMVIFIISGGGSTLLCQPDNLTCSDEGNILQSLFYASANIEEINTIRKHLSKARGGYLAKHAYPARIVSLIFSDVPGDNLEFIASGPTVKDTTTIADAEKILKKYNVEKETGLNDITLVETPKDDIYFKNVKNILLISNKIALTAMAQYAESRGYNAEVRTSTMTGEARDVAQDITENLHDAGGHTVLLYGGETTVTIEYLGKGGRNTELAIAALLQLKENETLASITSDGRDNTDFAGAICDMITMETAEKLNLDVKDHLIHNHSYVFFDAVGDYVKTGNTGRNVSDFVIAVKK